MVDSDHTVVMANRTLYDTYGLKPKDIIGTFCPKSIHGLDGPYPGCPVEEAHETGQSVERELYDEPTDRWLSSAAYVTGLLTPDGKAVYLHIVQDISAKKAADNALADLRAALEDTVARRTEELETANRDLQREILERRRAEERIRRLAYYDTLTGLPNRASFSDLLAKDILKARAQDKRVGVALLDLDGFKVVNDTTGHDAGDAMLRVVGKRLEEATREIDSAARMGGDEFLFIFREIDEPADVESICERLLEVFREPFTIEGRQFNITASVGGAVFPDDGADEVTLMKRADMAMYQAKNSGGDRFCRLEPGGPATLAG
jgi:diguanylate cyclase (GGDEF)-like protein